MERQSRIMDGQRAVHEQLLSRMEQLKQTAREKQEVSKQALESMNESNELLSKQNRRLVELTESHAKLRDKSTRQQQRIEALESSAKRNKAILASLR